MINVVIVCKDRLSLTRQALESLYSGNPRDSFNLTIVDDGSQDWRTAKLLREWPETHPNAVTLRTSGDGVVGRVKNLGIFYSRQYWGEGDWLYLSDNDVWFQDDALKKLTKFAEFTELLSYKLWGGQIHPFHQPIGLIGRSDKKELPVIGHEHQILDGPSWLMRWQIWDHYGPFVTTGAVGPCQSEDAEFCKRLTEVKDGGSYQSFGKSEPKPGRIGVIIPHVVVHTGITNSNGEDAPGKDARMPMIPSGVMVE